MAMNNLVKIVTFFEKDSISDQKNKASLLEVANNAKIPIERLVLKNVVVNVADTQITLNKDAIIGVLSTVHHIEISQWVRILNMEEYEYLMTFIVNCKSLQTARLEFPSIPPRVPSEALERLRNRKPRVEWIIGRLLHKLDNITGKWEISFLGGCINANASATSGEVLPLSRQKTGEKQFIEGGDISINHDRKRLMEMLTWPAKSEKFRKVTKSLPPSSDSKEQPDYTLPHMKQVVTDACLSMVSHKLGNRWKSFAYQQLKLFHADVDNCEYKKQSLPDVIMECLHTWQIREGRLATYEVLAKHLYNFNFNKSVWGLLQSSQ